MAGTSDMFWASAVSERVDTREAVREAAAAIQAARSGTPDLVIAFVSPHHAAAYDRIGGWVRDAIGEVTFIGASATGVIGGGRELEGREGLSLTAAFLPDARISAFSVAAPPGDGSREAWVQALEIAPDDRRTCLVLIDPKTCDSESLLRTLDSALPKGLKIGGLASPYGDGPAALFAAESVQRGGALLCLLDGAFETQSVVAQGCRPIGEPLIVTRVKGNVIRELNAGKPTEVLRKLYETLDGRDHALFNSSLFLGLEMQGKQGQLQQGDFLIRNILGIDTEAGAMAIDTKLPTYQVVQFHMRDREAAAQDVARKLRSLAPDLAARVRGGLLFSGLGRGERLYGVPNHDSDAFARRVGDVSLSGCFCNGEIGPVAGRTFLHGYTSVYTVFSELAR